MIRRSLRQFVLGAWAIMSPALVAQEILPNPLREVTPVPPVTIQGPVLPGTSQVPFTLDVPGVVDGPVQAPCDHCGRQISIPKLTLYDREQETTVTKLHLKENVSREVIDKVEVEYREEIRVVTEMVLQERAEPRDVVTYRTEEITTICPDTGKPVIKLQQVPCVKTVLVKVYDKVPRERLVKVRVPCLKTVPQEVDVKKLCVHDTQEAAICRKLDIAIQPNHVTAPCCPLVPFPPRPCVGENCHPK